MHNHQQSYTRDTIGTVLIVLLYVLAIVSLFL